jgi:hypothetical protein
MSGMVVFAKRRHRLAAAAASLAALAGLAWLALGAVLPPAARPADAPPREFSATRAYEHVRSVAAEPHVVGSGPNDLVRQYLVGTLADLGAATQLQENTGLDAEDPGGVAAARVRNVIGLLEGTDPSGRVFLVAHYDSVQVGPGGSDDGAGVATVLETMRALAAGPRPRNDVVAVFTDGEEACLCGAEAFVTLNPLATEGGVVLNFEASGTRGPVVMFETSRGNARLADLYARVPRPVATSFAAEIYRILPNDTDFTLFREDHRFTGLNSAYIDGSAAYHTPQDTPARMDRRSLQHHGDGALTLARELADADLAGLRQPAGHDATYFPAFGTLVRYPGWLVWPLAILAVLAVAAAAWLARRRGLLTWPRAATGLGLAVIPLLVAPVAAQLMWLAAVAARPGYAEMIDPWRPGWFRWAVLALSATVLFTWYALLRRRLGPVALALGALGWLALLGVVLAAATPGGSYLTALPALFGGAAVAGALLLRPPLAALGPLVVGAAVAIVVLAPTVSLFFPALGLATAGAPAFLAIALGLALLPVLDLLFAPALHPGVRETAAPAAPEIDPAQQTAPLAAPEIDPAQQTAPLAAPEIDPAQQTAPPAGGTGSGGLPDAAPATAGPARGGGRRRGLVAALPAAACGLLTIAAIAAGVATDRFDADHPMPAQLMYVMDADTGEAHWVSNEEEPGAWTSQYVDDRRNLADAYPILGGDLATGPAIAADLPPPDVSVVSDITTGDERELWLRVVPQREVRLAYLRVQGSPVVRATIAGRGVTTSQRSRFGVLFHAPPSAGVDVELVVRPGAALTLRVMDGSTGLEELPDFRPRPPDVGIAGDHASELLLVARTIEFEAEPSTGGGEGPGQGPSEP